MINDTVVQDYIRWIRNNAGIPVNGFAIDNPNKQQVLDNKDIYKEALNFGKDAINKFVHPQANIQAARLLFTPQRREKIYG